MTIRHACILCIAILVPTHTFACDPSALRDNVDRLKASSPEVGSKIGFDCVDILKDPNNEEFLNKFVHDFVDAELSNNLNAASTVDKCSAEDVQAACR